MERPSVVRLVHYVTHGTPPKADGTQTYKSVCRGAVITEIHPGDDDTTISLAVFQPEGIYFNRGVDYSHDNKPGTWHWPERR